MRNKTREAFLKIGVAVVVGLYLLDLVVIGPATTSWKARSERIGELQEKVKRGRQLMEREKSLRARWADMLRTDLPDDLSVAETEVFKAIGRWTRDSRVSFSNLAPQWRQHEGNYDTYECRASATSDQASIGRLLYEMETDPLAARIEELEITGRDAQGKAINFAVRFSFIHLADAAPASSGKAAR